MTRQAWKALAAAALLSAGGAWAQGASGAEAQGQDRGAQEPRGDDARHSRTTEDDDRDALTGEIVDVRGGVVYVEVEGAAVPLHVDRGTTIDGARFRGAASLRRELPQGENVRVEIERRGVRNVAHAIEVLDDVDDVDREGAAGEPARGAGDDAAPGDDAR